MTREQPAGVVQRLGARAEAEPDAPALSARSADGHWTRLTNAELLRRVHTAGHALRSMDHPTGKVLIALPNGVDFFAWVLAAWSAGLTPLIAPPGSSERELDTLFSSQPEPRSATHVCRPAPQHEAADRGPVRPGPEPEQAWCMPSGGSTGLPRFIPVAGRPSQQLASQSRLLRSLGWQPRSTQLVMGPLHHAAPYTSAMTGLYADNHIVVVERFTREAVEDAVARFSPTWLQATPHQMALLLADKATVSRLAEHLTGLMHTAAPCPRPVKKAWIDLLGGDRLFELYGSTQMIGAVISSGTQWLARPGTVGRPHMTQVRIVGPDGAELPRGTVGEVFMRTAATRRLGAAQAAHLRAHGGGFYSVGDLGYLDDDGYLYLTDRVDDVINVGGANVSAREVEGVLLDHPDVREALVVGRAHDLLGQVVSALVVPADPAQPPSGADLRAFCAQRLEAHKVPASVETVPEFERSHAGKIERYRYQ
ncbi:class I adenylate-forming enzyme family protein [Streptomyces sp. NPDC000345]|uniref:class I adenylate-forming enzyme family protein n=1 Tax=Streptomyces sp. NPDC000345 TaxID=3364537 RepID=UPI00367A6469